MQEVKMKRAPPQSSPVVLPVAVCQGRRSEVREVDRDLSVKAVHQSAVLMDSYREACSVEIFFQEPAVP